MLQQMLVPHSFSRLNGLPLYENPHFAVHLSVHEHLGCVHILAIINKAALSLHAHIPGWTFTSQA